VDAITIPIFLWKKPSGSENIEVKFLFDWVVNIKIDILQEDSKS
jgi:hypothetical protein